MQRSGWLVETFTRSVYLHRMFMSSKLEVVRTIVILFYIVFANKSPFLCALSHRIQQSDGSFPLKTHIEEYQPMECQVMVLKSVLFWANPHESFSLSVSDIKSPLNRDS